MKIDKKTFDVLKTSFLKRMEPLHLADHVKGHLAAVLVGAVNDTNRHFNILIPKNQTTNSATMIEKKCKTCGKTFAAYPYWRIANCESCREISRHEIERIENE